MPRCRSFALRELPSLQQVNLSLTGLAWWRWCLIGTTGQDQGTHRLRRHRQTATAATPASPCRLAGSGAPLACSWRSCGRRRCVTAGSTSPPTGPRSSAGRSGCRQDTGRRPWGSSYGSLPGYARALGRGMARASDLVTGMIEHHPREETLVSVRHRRGSRAPGSGHRRRAAAIPAYLEPTKFGNVPLYEHFGFEVTGTLNPPNGAPPLTAM
jgi:hypothetical protein